MQTPVAIVYEPKGGDSTPPNAATGPATTRSRSAGRRRRLRLGARAATFDLGLRHVGERHAPTPKPGSEDDVSPDWGSSQCIENRQELSFAEPALLASCEETAHSSDMHFDPTQIPATLREKIAALHQDSEHGALASSVRRLRELASSQEPSQQEVSEAMELTAEALEAVEDSQESILNLLDRLLGAASAAPTSTDREASGNRAQAQLQAFRQAFDEGRFPVSDAPARSEDVARRWVDDGLLVSADELGRAWHRKRQSLEQACDRGELFRIRVGGRWYYPAVFRVLMADDVGRVSRAMAGVDPVSQFIFWSRTHGALGGRTIAQALDAGEGTRAVALAAALGEEAGRPVDASA
ncbi:MAG TPA: hypothetical protein PK177_04860 [Burkholderiaceae bacterium]|nr:hypothetical protein [Burkholderiaceae bacterium]